MKQSSNPEEVKIEVPAGSAEPGGDDLLDPMQQRGLFQRVADFMFGFDFFISYCWADGRNYAIELQRKLKTQGFNCFLDSSDYAKGDNWRVAGQRALKKTSRLILVGTPKAVLSEPVANELRIFSGLQRRVFPIDFGGALAGIGTGEGIFRYLDHDMLRVNETGTALTDGPSEDVLQQIRESFNLLRQDQKRIRWFGGLAAVFALVAAVAVVMFFVAQNQTKKAKRSASLTHLYTAGRFQNENLADEAVAYLCRSVRTDQSNQLAKDKLVATLATTGFVPFMEQYRDPESFGARHRADGFTALAFSGDGSRLLITDNDFLSNKQLSLWEVGSSSKLINIPISRVLTQNTMVNPAGTRFVIESEDKTYFDVYRFPDTGDPLLHKFQAAWVRSQELDDKLRGDLDKLESEKPEKQAVEKEKQEIDEEIDRLRDEVEKSLKIARIDLPASTAPEGEEESVSHLRDGVMSGQGEIILLSGNAAQVWSAETGEPVSPVLTFEGSGTSQAISADGTSVVVGDSDGMLHVWQAPVWKEEAGPFKDDDLEGSVRHVAVSADGGVVAAVFGDTNEAKAGRAWNVATGERMSDFDSQTPIQWMRLNRNGSAAITWCEGRDEVGPAEATLWPLGPDPHAAEDGTEVSFRDISAITMDRSGEKFITASGRTAQIRDAVNGNPLSATLTAPGDVRSVAFSPDGKRIALGTKNGFAGVWDWAGRTLVAPRYLWDGISNDTIQNGKFAASVSAREVLVVDLETHQEKHLSHPEDVKFVRLARNGSVLAAGAGNSIFLWNPATGEKLSEPLVVLDGKVLADETKDDFEKVALSGDGSRMVVVQKDGFKTTVWDLRKQTGQVSQPIEDEKFPDWAEHKRGPLKVELSDDGKRAMFAVITKFGGNVLVYDLESRTVLYSKEIKKSEGSPERQSQLSADGKKVAWWEDNAVHLVDLDSKRDLDKPISLDDMVMTVAFGSTNVQLITGAGDGTVVLWNTAKATHSQPMRHQAPVECIAMSQDGTRLVTATHGRKVRVWDVASGEALTPPISWAGSLVASIASVGFSLDGSNIFAHSFLYSAGGESLSIWEIPRWEEVDMPEWFLTMAEALGRRRIDERGFPQDVSLEESRKIRESALSQEGAGKAVKLARNVLAPEPTSERIDPVAPALAAPASAPDSTPATPAASDDPLSQIKTFLEAWIGAGNSETEAGVAQADYYTDPAQIEGKPMTQAEISAEQAEFEKQFPVRVFKYVEHEIVASNPDKTITVNVLQHVHLRTAAGREREMEIRDQLSLHSIDGMLKIESRQRIDTRKIR